MTSQYTCHLLFIRIEPTLKGKKLHTDIKYQMASLGATLEAAATEVVFTFTFLYCLKFFAMTNSNFIM